MEKIIIKSINKPKEKNTDYLIIWFCKAFGLVSEKGGNDIEVQIMKKFLIASFENKGLSSSEIKIGKQPIARSTIIYNLNRFIESGLVVKKGRKYYFRAKELSSAIEEIEYDIEREMQRMLDIAKEFDRLFEMNRRKTRKMKIAKGV